MLYEICKYANYMKYVFVFLSKKHIIGIIFKIISTNTALIHTYLTGNPA